MAVGLASASSQAIDEEARAEVDVLNSRLEKTTQLTRKIQASLGRLNTTGESVQSVAGPLYGEVQRLQVLGNNINSVLAAIERLRQPAENKNEEEQIIRAGPEKAGLNEYLASLKRLNRSHHEMQASNLRANQVTMAELSRLLKFGDGQLEAYFDRLIRTETPRNIEPLHYFHKGEPYPVLAQETTGRLGLLCSNSASSLQGGGTGSTMARIYVEIRGPYLASSLTNLGAASVNTAKKKNPGATYRGGTNGFTAYAQAIEGMFLAEFDNICSIFPRDSWSFVFQNTVQGAITEMARTLRELNVHIKAHLGTDCFLAYEIIDVVSKLSEVMESRVGDTRDLFIGAVKPIRETAKSSLSELLEDNKRKVNALPLQPNDTAPPPVVPDATQRLTGMYNYLNPLSSIVISLGDGGWKHGGAGASRATDGTPSLASFEIGADGRQLFANYCLDTFDSLLTALESKARTVSKNKAVQGILLGNSTAFIDMATRDSELGRLLLNRGELMEKWKKRATVLYSDQCVELSRHLFDTIHTNKGPRPTSGQIDSATVVKSLNGKERDKIKSSFDNFNEGFDAMVSKHRTYTMDREVRKMFGEDIGKQLQPLYRRFWDRYHQIDKGKGKHVKYDKASIDSIFASLCA